MAYSECELLGRLQDVVARLGCTKLLLVALHCCSLTVDDRTLTVLFIAPSTVGCLEGVHAHGRLLEQKGLLNEADGLEHSDGLFCFVCWT